MGRSNTDTNTIKNLMPRFPYVYAWHKMLGSYDYYVAEQMTYAARDNMSKDATYLKDNGDWASVLTLEPDNVELLQGFIPKEHIPNFEEENQE